MYTVKTAHPPLLEAMGGYRPRRSLLPWPTAEEEDPADIAEWAAFGLIFALAVLSFADARPRGHSEIDFLENDEFSVADLFECLRFCNGELYFSADYLRGRCMKTDITVRRDGRVTLTTRNRGQAALRWLDRLQGKKTLKLV